MMGWAVFARRQKLHKAVTVCLHIQKERTSPGVYPDETLDAARRKAEKARDNIAEGDD
jgi:hypothetical protein